MSNVSAWHASGMNHGGNPGGSNWNFWSRLANTDEWARGRTWLFKLSFLNLSLHPVSLIQGIPFIQKTFQRAHIDHLVPRSELTEIVQCPSGSFQMESPPEILSLCIDGEMLGFNHHKKVSTLSISYLLSVYTPWWLSQSASWCHPAYLR